MVLGRSRQRRTASVVLRLALGLSLLLLPARQPAGPAAAIAQPLPAAASAATVRITPQGLDQPSLAVQVGDTVTWLNETSEALSLVSGAAHQVYLPALARNSRLAAAGSPASPALTTSPITSGFGKGTPARAMALAPFDAAVPPGGQYQYTFSTAGNYAYFVSPRFDWKGQVTVSSPPPALVIPAVRQDVSTSVFAATEFLYTGANPVQTGVISGTIDSRRAAVLRGKVLARDGQPLSGVAVSVLAHSEFGQSLSRADGFFDLAVNGGGALTVSYTKSGYLPVQRTVGVPWQDYVAVPNVVLIARDSQATTVDLAASAAMQVARGSSQTDTSGTRQATVLFPQGTQATMTLASGSSQPLTALRVRATEYTVGANGRQAMPGDLPPTSGYTYAVDLSVDEAEAAGATDVRFSQPVPFYLENFLGFPAGSAVPMAYYDRALGRWVPSQNGRVIKVLGATGGLAGLDTNGDGAPDDGATLAALGVTDAERAQLASLYAAGTTLWRVPVGHFSPYDANWPVSCPGCQPPDQPPPDDEEDDEPCEAAGSIIRCQTQNLGQAVPIVGTPFHLHYASDRVSGNQRAFTLSIPLSGSSVPAGLKRIDVKVDVAGRGFTQSFPASPDQRWTFTWDGKDAYGRTLQGQQPVSVQIGYAYDGTYQMPAAGQESFGLVSGVPLPGTTTRAEVVRWQSWNGSIGSWGAAYMGTRGWSLDVHHAYDPAGRVLHLGDGTRRSARGLLGDAIITVAGNGNDGFSGDGGLATGAELSSPMDVAAGPDGSLYIADSINSRIRRVAPNGVISTVAGTGTPGFSGDGGPAAQAQIAAPFGVAAGPDGSFYIADWGAAGVRRVASNGVITTVAGSGVPGFAGDGGPAIQAQLNQPTGLAVGPDGTLYIAELGNHRVRRVGTDGIITTLAGNGVNGYSGDGGPAAAAQLNMPAGVAVGRDGSVYIADSANSRVRRVGPDGIISTVAGGDTVGLGDGGPATEAELGGPWDVALGLDFTLYIADPVDSRVRRVSPDGVITTVAGDGAEGYGGDGGPAGLAQLSDASGIAVGPDGRIFLADAGNARVRQVMTALPGFASDDIFFASRDGGEVYVFTGEGRHLRTLEALTGAVRYQFAYDGAGRLITVQDADGNLTTVERDAGGNPTAIVAPFGQRTTLALDASGDLAGITNPAGEAVQLTYNTGGLLATLTDPRGNVSRYSYDSQGRLTRAEDPVGGSKALSRVDSGSGYTVTLTTALGRTTTYRVERRAIGGVRRVATDPSGAQAELLIGADGTRRLTYPDGTVESFTFGPDPRWGIQAPVLTSLTRTTPGGLVDTRSWQRSAALANPADPLSLQTLTDTVTINGRTFTTVYDAATRTSTGASAAGRQSSFTLDTRGRPVEAQIADLFRASYSYDGRGRLAGLSRGSGLEARSLGLTYDSGGLLAGMADPLGRTIGLGYDAAGRATALTLPGGQTAAFGYDASGNVTSITPSGKPAHGFSYTSVDQLAAYTPPSLGAEPAQTTFSYNADRQTTGVTRPDGLNVTYGYDAGGRLTTVTAPHGQVQRAYAGSTRILSSITAPGGVVLSFTHDAGLPTGETWSGPVAGSVTRTFDTSFRVATQTVNGAGTVAFTYDQDDLLTQAGDLFLTRNPQNGLESGTTLGAVTTTTSYNGFGELSSHSASAGSSIYSAGYSSDKLGRITQKTETIGGVTDTYAYSYDPAGWLSGVQKNGATTAIYTYDGNGNRLSYTGPGGAVSGTYDAQDRLTQYGSTAYSYTANGDLKSKTAGGQTTTYEYDALGNLLTVVQPSGVPITYVVDGKDRRVGKKVSGALVQGFLYQDALRPVAELDGSGNLVSRFVYASPTGAPAYMVKGGNTYRIVADHLGSPRLVVDSATFAIAQRMDYDEFGRVTADTNPGFQPFGFAGGLYDRDAGLVRFGARDYDPETGRWTAKDPIGFRGGDTNLYTYAGNDPVNRVDPTGRNGLLLLIVVGVAAVAIALAVAALPAKVVGEAAAARNRVMEQGSAKTTECDGVGEDFEEHLKHAQDVIDMATRAAKEGAEVIGQTPTSPAGVVGKAVRDVGQFIGIGEP